ncbi:hypothetical protein D3C86_2073390 [compost metagenome]
MDIIFRQRAIHRVCGDHQAGKCLQVVLQLGNQIGTVGKVLGKIPDRGLLFVAKVLACTVSGELFEVGIGKARQQ